MMAAVAGRADPKTAAVPHPRHIKRLSISRVVLILLICCFGCLGLSFFYYGSLLQQVPSKPLIHNNHQAQVIAGLDRPVLAADLRLGTLNCSKYGGPLLLADTQEMVYWQRIPSDKAFVSPFHYGASHEPRYMTFEPDEGGFNNIRMAYETVLALAHAMGRILVLPPEQEFYLLSDTKKGGETREFSFKDFFPMDMIASELRGLQVITTQEFLQRVMTGRVHVQYQWNRQSAFPPNNRTSWDGMTGAIQAQLEPWLRRVAVVPDWDPEVCMAAFPATTDPNDAKKLLEIFNEWNRTGFPPKEHFIGKPVSVYASVTERMAENNKNRPRLCIYDQSLQQEPLIHFGGKQRDGVRLLTHFYGFLFFQDWRQDVWTKRFIRDNVRYIDEIQCAAARIVQAVRQHARARNPANYKGLYDAFHIRRGEFQYKRTRMSAKKIYLISRDQIPEGTTVYVATDERQKEFFKDMVAHYDLMYLDDFMHLLGDVNPNFYGMIDQLVASRSRTFFGCWFSTFTSYINRIRGYHADRLKLPGFQTGVIESYFYALPEHKMKMRQYWPLSGAFHSREFPVSWRNIDQGIGKVSQ